MLEVHGSASVSSAQPGSDTGPGRSKGLPAGPASACGAPHLPKLNVPPSRLPPVGSASMTSAQPGSGTKPGPASSPRARWRARDPRRRTARHSALTRRSAAPPGDSARSMPLPLGQHTASMYIQTPASGQDSSANRGANFFYYNTIVHYCTNNCQKEIKNNSKPRCALCALFLYYLLLNMPSLPPLSPGFPL